MTATRSMWLLDFLRKPGVKGEVQGVAPTQLAAIDQDGKKVPSETENVKEYVVKQKVRKMDRLLDEVVKFSGSEVVFFIILAGLLTWAFLGIPYGRTTNWQVLISDIQAIVSYIFDSFLMRQQLNVYDEAMVVAAELRSRIMSHDRMLKQIKIEIDQDPQRWVPESVENKGVGEFERQLPQENWFGRFSTRFSIILGHVVSVGLFWVCVFVWIGFGQYCGWSDMWQLYMNSASSAFMVFIFSFLANIRERHSAYTKECLDAIYQVDSALESRLRLLTDDSLENDVVIVPAPKVNILQRIIFYYADVVGTLVGIVLLISVFVVWVAIGPAMHFSSNWWLLIGTYAGLVGMNDGFVLRNVQACLRRYEDVEFVKIHDDDVKLFQIVDLPMPEEEVVDSTSLSQRVSEPMCRLCAHEMTVMAGFLVIIGLIVGASAMRWSLTGQLLCNVPPSLIESFFMLILITGHNAVDARKRVDLRNIYERRLKLLSFANSFSSQKLEA